MKRMLVATLAVLLAAALAAGTAHAAPSDSPPDMINVDGSVYYTGGVPAGNCTPVTVGLYSKDGKLKYSEQICTGQYFPPVDQFYHKYRTALAGTAGEDTVVVKALGTSNSATAKTFTVIDITGPRPGIVSDIGSAVNYVIGLIIPNKEGTTQPEQPAQPGQTGQPGTAPAATPQPAIPNDVAGASFILVMTVIAAAFILFSRKRKKGMISNKLLVFSLLVILMTSTIWISEEKNANAPAINEAGASNGIAGTIAGAANKIIVEGGFYPTGAATEGEGGAQTSDVSYVLVNNASRGRAYGPNGEDMLNITWANYSYMYISDPEIEAQLCGETCNPANGNCTLFNISLIRKDTGDYTQNISVCGMEGLPAPDAQYYTRFMATLTTEDGASTSEYYVNVTASNSTYWGRNGTGGSSKVFIDVHLTNLNDNTPPQWSGNSSSIPSVYSTTNSSAFNITWTDVAGGSGVSTVKFESNFSGTKTNYTMASFGGNVSNYNNTLPAGLFYWKSWGSDLNGNWNSTDTWYFTISTADNPVSLTIDNTTAAYPNQDVTITYGTPTTVTGTATADATLWRNETSVSTTDAQTLDAGLYAYKINATGGNYTANATGLTYYLLVKQAPNPLTLTLNTQPNSITVTYGTAVTPTGSGPDGVTVTRNDSDVTNGAAEYLAVGYYAFKANSTGSTNYAVNSTGVTYYATITNGTSSVSVTLSPSSSITYGTQSTATCTQNTGDPGATLTLRRNFTLVNTSTSGSVTSTSLLAAGPYNYTCTYLTSGNYTSTSSMNNDLTIGKASTLTRLYLNDTEGNKNYGVNDIANFTVTVDASGGTVYLNTNISGWAVNYTTTPLMNITTLDTAGFYNITGYFLANENYTASSQTYYATVSSDNPPRWSANSTSIPNNYSITNATKFNVTWTDLETSVDVVLIEGNWSGSAKNYTMFSFNSSLFSYNDTLPAGYFCWKSYANDTLGNQNATSTVCPKIYNASNIVNIYLNNGTQYMNQDITVNYGTTTNATANATIEPASLYRNETAVANPDILVLGVGTHTYKANATGNRNYTTNFTGANYSIIVLNKTTVCSITTSPSGSTTYGTPTTAKCWCTNVEQTSHLYRNDSNVDSENNTALTLPGGPWNYTCNVTASQNYTAGTTSSAYSVAVAPMTLTFLLNGTDGDRTYLNSSFANFTTTTVPSGLPITLYTNYSDGTNKQWNSSTSPFSNLTRFTAELGKYNFTSAFAGNQNYSAASSTHYATVILRQPTGITLYFNGGTGTSFDTGTSINITAVLNVSGKTIYLFTSLTNYTQSNDSSVTMNVSTFGTAGTYNVTAWFLGDTDYEASNATATLTISTPAPPSGGGGGGGGGGGAAAPAPAAKPTYAVSNYMYSYGNGDVYGFDYSIKNPSSSAMDIAVSTEITKGGISFWKKEDSVRVNPNSTYAWKNDAGQVICSTPYGTYDVTVRWTRNGAVEKTDTLTYYVSYQCREALITVTADKLVYGPSDTAHITVNITNIGNAPIDNGLVSELLSGPNKTQEFSQTVSLKPEETNTHANDVRLSDFQSGTYRYGATLTEGGETLGEGSATFMVVVPVDIVYYALPTATVGAVLVVLWRGRKPLTLRKTIVMLAVGTKVDFKLVNRTKHCFKNVVIRDTVPALIAMKGVKPKPSKKKKLKSGAMQLEWTLAHLMPREKKQFNYNLNKRKRFLPKAKIIKFERDREAEEQLAKQALAAIGKGVSPKEAKHLQKDVQRLQNERAQLQSRLNEINSQLRELGGHVGRHARRLHGHVNRHVTRLKGHVRKHAARFAARVRPKHAARRAAGRNRRQKAHKRKRR